MDEVVEGDRGAVRGAETVLPRPVHVEAVRVHPGGAPELPLPLPAVHPLRAGDVSHPLKGEREDALLACCRA